MPTISMFHGLLVKMFFMDNERHHAPHIHVEYQSDKATYDIPSGDRLAGALPISKERLVLAWIELHRDELLADWQLAVRGEELFRIDPLK
jgi:hypothetical protein